MNKVITINLGGTAYQLEEGGFDALRAYLDSAAARLQGNPDRDEIISDIEQAIGEKFRALLNSYKTVIIAKEVAAVLAEMGPIEAGPGATAGGAATGSSQPPPETSATGQPGGTPKRLYRVYEGAMISGVCNGLAAYANVDPTLVRLAFVVLTIFWGAGIAVYFAMAIIVPSAKSPEEKAAAHGAAQFTAQEFIRRAREGYYDAMKSFPDRHARREWKRRFRREMRGWRMGFHQEAAQGTPPFRPNWPPAWTPGAHPGLGAALPLFSLLHGALTIVWLCALISLLATGALFGVALPAGVPVWAGLILLMFVFGFLVWPLKMARRAAYYHGFGGPGWTWPFIFVVDALVWFAFVAVLIWLAIHYVPQAREAVHHLPAVIHEAVDNIRDWWNKK